MTTVRFRLILVVVLALVPGLFGGCRDRVEKLDEYLRAAQKAWAFQGAALVAIDSQVIIARGYGQANLEFKTPNTPQTKFFIGSITKQFTAAAILKLQEMGKLNVHDPLAEHLPYYPGPAAEKITIHHLLTHTAGLPNYTDVPEILDQRTEAIAPTELMEYFMHQPLLFEPGEKFHYSNSGYIVLGAVVEAVSGQSYEAFLHRYILRPAGMHNSGYGRREAAIPNRASGYTVDEARDPIIAVPIHFSVLHTAGALYSTAEDLLAWSLALRDGSVLDDSLVNAMLSDHGHGYGYGWSIDSTYGHKHCFHGGYLDGFNTTIEIWPDSALTVVVLSNEDETPVKKMARGLASICLFGRPYIWPEIKTPVALSDTALDDLAGMYQFGYDDYIYIMRHSDSLFVHRLGHPPENLLPKGPDEFFLESDNTITVDFVRNGTGTVIGLRMWDEGIRRRGQRLVTGSDREHLPPCEESKLDWSVHGKAVGVYMIRGDLAPAKEPLLIEVFRRDDRLWARVGGFPPTLLRPCSDRVLTHQDGDFRLRLVFDSTESEVIGCVVRFGSQYEEGLKVR